MKKNGFTLAEVLITLAIIGVVATMTLPALMNNTQEQQAKTAYKKAINTLTEAVQLNSAIANFDYSDLDKGYGSIANVEDEDEQSLAGILANRTSVDLAKSGDTVIKNVKWDAGQTIYLRDGSALIFPTGNTIDPDTYTDKQTDGLVKGFSIILDINGDKAPNTLSNCMGNADGEVDTDSLMAGNPNTKDAEDTTGTEGEGGDDSGSEVSCTKKTRVIKDQFLIKLRGNVAQPDGSAAIWVYEN